MLVHLPIGFQDECINVGSINQLLLLVRPLRSLIDEVNKDTSTTFIILHKEFDCIRQTSRAHIVCKFEINLNVLPSKFDST